MIGEKNIDVNEAMRDIENFLRNNIMYILKNKYDNDWEKHLGVSDERLAIWTSRKEEEKKRLNNQSIENRIIYYSDFYDLKTIIVKNWDIFKDCFKERKIIEHQLSQLESFRNPNAHNRDILEHQKHLLIGYIGEIKNAIMNFKGSIEKKSTYFPEYESLNINGKTYKNPWANLKGIFRPGDEIEIYVYATAPNTQKILYKLVNNSELNSGEWEEKNHFKIIIDDKKIGNVKKTIMFKSDADYHLNNDYGFDGLIPITYTVVP